MPQNPVMFVMFIDDLVEEVTLIRPGDDGKPDGKDNNYTRQHNQSQNYLGRLAG